MRDRSTPFFPYSNWDVVPALLGVSHCVSVIAWFVAFRQLPWWANGLLGIVYAFSIAWNVNSVSHNFIHNPFFKFKWLNRLFSLLESVTMGFSQTYYDRVHLNHHMGNNDRQDENGDTVDWVSFYRQGKNGEPENAWRYMFLSYFRDDFELAHRAMKTQSPADARWGRFELFCVGLSFVLGFLLNWQFMLLFIPCYYLGHSLSALNGYFEHLGANPDVPIAWGVSSYGWLYNWTWLNNGYHAEHHYRPKMHWTKMRQLHLQIKDQQQAAGVKVIRDAHVLGFLHYLPWPSRFFSSASSGSPGKAPDALGNA